MSNEPILSRLRRVNPVPQPQHVDDPELFSRIVSLPPDPVAAPPKRMIVRPRRSLVVAVALIALLAFASVAISQWAIGGDAVRPRVTRVEYLRAQKQLELPPGATWPKFHAVKNSVTSRGAGGGQAVLVAQNAWECYWVAAIRRHDPAAERRALTRLDALLADNIIVAPRGASENWTPPRPPNHPYAIFARDGGVRWKRAAYAAAVAGHPHNLVQSCRVNAPAP